MEELIPNTVDTSSISFDEPSAIAPPPPPPEEITTAILQGGGELNSSETLELTKEVKNQQAMGDNTFVAGAKAEHEAVARQEIIDKHLAGDVVDLAVLDKALSSRQDSVPEWKARIAKGFVETPIVNTEEEVIAHNKVMKDLSIFSEVQAARNNAQAAIDKAFEGWTWGEIIPDVLLAIIEPGAEQVTLANAVADITGETNIAGMLLPLVSINRMADYAADLPPQESIDLLKKVIGMTIDRQNQFGIGQNKGTNLYMAQTLLNTINENRSQEGFLGVKNTGDAMVQLNAVLDTLALGGVIRGGRGLFRKVFTKMFGKADDPVLETFQLSAKVAPINLKVDILENPGSLIDVLEQAKPGTTGKILRESDPEELDEALEAVGSSVTAVQQRSSPSLSGTIDPITLPPSATNPRLKGLVETLQGGFDVNLLGGAADRGKIMQKFHEQVIEGIEGFIHPSKSFIRPPKEGDNLSLGTSVTRFGKNIDEPFDVGDIQDAEFLQQIYKARGEATEVVTDSNGKHWLEVTRRHSLSEADAGVFSSVTGQRLTGWVPSMFKKWFMGWSRSIKNTADGMHPQAMTSWANDLGSLVKRELLDVAKPFFKAQTAWNKTDYNFASRALLEGEKEQAVFSTRVLRERYPAISDTAIEAYHSYRAAVDGVQLMRSVEFGKKLIQGGHKQLDIGDTQLFGSVVKERPVVSKLLTNDKGEHLVDDLIQGARLQGDQIWDATSKEVVPLTQQLVDELYTQGGRVVRLSSKFEAGEAGSFSHVIVRSVNDMTISDIPLYPNYGRKGYAIERFYDKAGFVVEQVSSKRMLNGVEGIGKQGVSIVGTISEAKAMIRYLQRKNPGEQFEWKQSRELDNLLDEAAGGNGGPSWLKQRQDKVLTGAIGRDGLPTEGDTLGVAEAFNKTIQNTGSLPLQQTAGILKQRWMNQYGAFLSPEAKLQGGLPRSVSIISGAWDNAAIKAAGLDPSKVKNDARVLHHNITNMEHQAAGPIILAKRQWAAGLARAMGASDLTVAQVASKSLTRLNEANPALFIRHNTALLNIGYGVAYQVPQNTIGAFSMMSSQGLDGARAMVEMTHLANGLKLLGTNTADEALAYKAIAKSLGSDIEHAKQWVKRYKFSGIDGSASDVDNVVTYAISGGKLGGKLRLGSPLKRTNKAISGVVGKSIDVTNMGFWTAAHRQVRKEFIKQKKSIDDQDFWEAVRNQTREFGQNQNKSDLLAFELENNPLAFALQFTQHLMKLGTEGAAIVGKGLGFKTNSVLAKNQAQAVRTMSIYFATFGAAGVGTAGFHLMNDHLPDFLANPENEADKFMSNLMLGGLLDAVVNVGTEGDLSISSNTSPGGIVDAYNGYLDVIRKSYAAGTISVDAIDFLGAAASTFSKAARVYRGLPSLIEIKENLTDEEFFENLEFVYQAVKGTGLDVARTTKLGGDVAVSLAMLEHGKRFSKGTGAVKGDSTRKEAIGKLFGFSSRGEVVDRGISKSNYIKRLNVDALAKLAKEDGAIEFMNMVDANDPESLEKWKALQTKRANALATMLVPEYMIDQFETAMMNHALLTLQGHPGMSQLMDKMTKIVGMEEYLRTWKRHPDTTPEKVRAIEVYQAITEKNRVKVETERMLQRKLDNGSK